MPLRGQQQHIRPRTTPVTKASFYSGLTSVQGNGQEVSALQQFIIFFVLADYIRKEFVLSLHLEILEFPHKLIHDVHALITS